MSRSCFSTPPSWCRRSTAPRNSSCGDRIDWSSPTRMPISRSSQSHQRLDAPPAPAPSSRTVQSIGRATTSAIRSGALNAAVFGSTSANTTTITVITIGRVDHADVAEPGQQHAGRERRGGDVDGIVAEQQRADHPLARVEQPIDDRGAAVALLLQPMHAGARRRGQRRLAAGKKRRQQQADEDHDEREPVVGGHRSASFSHRERRAPRRRRRRAR